MNTFFKPSSIKIKIFLVLVLYVIIGTLFLVSYNTPRSSGPRELHTFDKVGLMIAYPTVLLSIPAFYVSENIFTTETNLSPLLTDSGCTNCTSDEFNQSIKSSSLLGLATGLIVEILFLYGIACVISSIRGFK